MNPIHDRSWTLKQIDTVISKNYVNKVNFKIFVSSDGVQDLKAITDSLNATHALGKYHVIQWTKHSFKIQQLKQVNWLLNNSFTLDASTVDLEKSIQELVLTGKVDKALYDLFKLRKNYQFASHQISPFVKYLRNNIESILIWDDPNYYGSFTETFVPQLVKSNFGNVGNAIQKRFS